MYVRQIQTDARAREKPCVRCGLSLRQHLDERHCPQCGLSVWMTLNGNDALDYSNAGWLRKAARGMWLIGMIQLVAMAAYLLAMAVDARSLMADFQDLSSARTHVRAPVSAAHQPESAAPDADADEGDIDATLVPAPPSRAMAAAAGLAGVYFVLEAGGLVLMAVHEQRYPDRVKSIRLGVRIMAGVSVVVGAGLIGAGVIGLGGGPTGVLFSWAATLIAEFTFAGCALVCWLWVRPIARRAGESSLARLCGYLMFLPVLPFLKAAPFLGLWMVYLVLPLLQFVPLIYIPLSVYIFLRCATLLRSAIPHAEEAWAAETRTAPAAAAAV